MPYSDAAAESLRPPEAGITMLLTQRSPYVPKVCVGREGPLASEILLVANTNYTYKTSPKADKEDWGWGFFEFAIGLAIEIAHELMIDLKIE